MHLICIDPCDILYAMLKDNNEMVSLHYNRLNCIVSSSNMAYVARVDFSTTELNDSHKNRAKKL